MRRTPLQEVVAGRQQSRTAERSGRTARPMKKCQEEVDDRNNSAAFVSNAARRRSNSYRSILMASLRSLPFGVAISCFAVICFARPHASGHPIIGTWNVVVPTTACQETWQFRPDGTTHNISGSEESTSNYAVTDQPNENGFFVLDDTITESNDKPDCGGSNTLVGDRAVVYLLPTPDGKFRLCSEASRNSCYALMIRVSQESSTSTGAAAFRAIDIGQSCSTVNAWEIAHVWC